MKTRGKITIAISGIIILATLILAGCNSDQKVETWVFKQYVFDESDSIKTQNGITVKLEPLNAGSVYRHPELFRFDSAQVPVQLSNVNKIYIVTRGGTWAHTFCFGKNFLSGMKLKITNNTPNPISLKGTKMYLKNDNGDSVMAITTLGDPTLVQAKDKENRWLPKSYAESDSSLISIITYYEDMYEKTRERSDIPYPVGIATEVIRQHIDEYKLIGDIDLTILPGTEYDGILFFPSLLSDNKISVKLHDFRVYTNSKMKDSAKTSFDFNLKPDTGRFWLDKNQQAWHEGVPPAEMEYFDKGQQKWIMRDSPQNKNN